MHVFIVAIDSGAFNSRDALVYCVATIGYLMNSLLSFLVDVFYVESHLMIVFIFTVAHYFTCQRLILLRHLNPIFLFGSFLHLQHIVVEHVQFTSRVISFNTNHASSAVLIHGHG